MRVVYWSTILPFGGEFCWEVKDCFPRVLMFGLLMDFVLFFRLNIVGYLV